MHLHLWYAFPPHALRLVDAAPIFESTLQNDFSRVILNHMVQCQPPDRVRVFHALGDPTRMAMLQHIGRGETVVSRLAEPLNITLTATLKHLRILEEAGLARSEKVGRERRCRVEAAALDGIERWIEETRQAWFFRLDNLDAYLKRTEPQ